MAETSTETEPKRRPIYKRPAGIILLPVVLIAGRAGTGWRLYARQWEETDDAFVDGNIYPVGTKVAGQIQSVFVNDNRTVKAGDIIAKVDPRDIQARLEQAQASLEAAKAD